MDVPGPGSRFFLSGRFTVVNGLLGDGVSTGGGLTKNGLGTLVLSGTSTYTGATVVNAGTLVVNGALSGTSGLGLATGASVGGTGSIAGNLTFGSGTQLACDGIPTGVEIIEPFRGNRENT